MSIWEGHESFLSAIVAKPGDDAPLLIYADWLEDNGDPRCAYLRAQCEFRKSPTEDLRRHLIEIYPHRHLAWTANLEQAGAIQANLTKYDFAWWGTGIGPAREAGGTYERFEFHDQPALPVQLLDGTFSWLRKSEPQSPYTNGALWKAFCAEKREQGYFVPDEFERFLSHDDLPARIRSCTDNYFERPPSADPEQSAPSAEWEDGSFVIFYADSQYCVLWGILLPREPARYAPILAGPPEDLFPGIWSDRREQDSPTPVLAASQFESFLFRTWIENEIWHATLWEESLRPLTPLEQAYVDHFNKEGS